MYKYLFNFTAPRECIICGDLAMFECRQCYQVHGAGLNTIAFCDSCKDTVSKVVITLRFFVRCLNYYARFVLEIILYM